MARMMPCIRIEPNDMQDTINGQPITMYSHYQ